MTGRAGIRRRLAIRAPRPIAPGDRRLSIVLPTYREARIGESVETVRATLEPVVSPSELEIVVVDDGSGDDTARRARDAGAHRVLSLPENRGKGAAVRAGVTEAGGRTILFTDADLAYSPEQIPRFLDAVEAGWDIVVGSRRHRDTETIEEASALRSLGGRIINGATRLVLAGGHEDTQCGIKAMRSDVARLWARRGRIDGFAFDVELYLLAETNGLSLHEVPVSVENSPVSSVRIARDATRLLRDLLRIRRAARRGGYHLTPEELSVLTGTGE